MNYLHGDWLDYDEVEKIKKYFEIKDVKYGGCVNNEGIIIDFSYNNRMYSYQRLTMTFSEDQISKMQTVALWNARTGMSKSISVDIYDIETSLNITDAPSQFIIKHNPAYDSLVSEETLRDWRYVSLIFDMIRIHVDDADGCKHLASLSYQDFKNDPKVRSIINIGILLQCETYANNSNGLPINFKKDWARDGICMAYHLITMNHPLMEMVKKYPEYKPRFCTVVEVARQLGLHEEQLIISNFTASIQESPDKWEL